MLVSQRKREERQSSPGGGVVRNGSPVGGTDIGMPEAASSIHDVPIDDDDNSSVTISEDSEEEDDGYSDDESRDDGISVGGEFRSCDAAGKPLEEVMQLFEDSLVAGMDVTTPG